ncbi:MAG: AAA family ATPase [Desulfovibrio sp.]|nr:AAA family ATPase [Desulfovibrio sp.]
MYIQSFHMDGFGIYADTSVENLTPGLTIFLGDNEAGKSTCMEFLRTMLTGYPEPHSRAAKDMPGPLRGGQAGGSLLLQTKEYGAVHLTRRPGKNGGVLTLTNADGAPLDHDILRFVLSGVRREVYRKVFGFSLTELEDLNSLTDEGIRNALYGASFGPGLRVPGEALALLRKKEEEIFKSSGSKPPLNALLRELNDVRRRKADLEQAGAGYDLLADELHQRQDELASLRAHKLELEEERRLLERRLGVWKQWNEWRTTGMSLERLAPASASFPEDGRARLAQACEAREGCEHHWSALKDKLERLRQRRDAVIPDTALLEALPELRRLAERKSGFRQAVTSLPLLEAECNRAREDLQRELSRLGPDWTCERIRATDRSLFAREDLERQAREMDAATSAHQAAVDKLHACNREVENAEREVSSAEAALAELPETAAELDAESRDGLRKALNRLEEAQRQRPARERALQEVQTTFTRACTPLRLTLPDEAQEHTGQHLDNLLQQQDEALKLAEEVQEKIRQAETAAQDVRQAEDWIGNLKKRMDHLYKEQNLDGLSKDELDVQASALRKLRALSATMTTEQERLAGLTGRIDSEPPLKAVRSVPMLAAACILFLGGLATLWSVWHFGPQALALPGNLQLPLEQWSGCLLVIIGVICLAVAIPFNNAELKRRRQEFEQLCIRRDTCALHLSELNEQASSLCVQANIESLDMITIEAREALLEHDRERFFQEERIHKEIESLKQEMDMAHAEMTLLQTCRAEADTVVQQIRRRWHGFMQGLHVNNVPSPEGAAAFFARVESARMAFGAVRTAQAELCALNDDIRAAEEHICSIPAVAKRLDGDAANLNDAVNAALESCRQADAMREQRIKAEAALQNARNEHRRATARQEEADAELRRIHDRLESARTQWQEALHSLGLGDALAPETVREAFKYMENCLSAETVMEQANSHLAQTRTELTALRAPLEDLLIRLGRQAQKDAEGQPDWLASLDCALAEAEKAAQAHAHRQNLSATVNEVEDECHSAEAALKSARDAESSLLALAGAVDAEDFLRQAAVHEQRESLTQRLQDLEDALLLAAGNMPWDDFLASFEDQDQDTQERRCAAIGEELHDLREREEKLLQQASALSGKVDALVNSSELSQLLLREASLVDSMERLAFAWSKLALAHEILEAAKQTFEQERQPEVIRLASTIFARITGRRWQGINASLENSTLLILREHGEPVSPENLSRGTREQAYLALRLAYIANHAAHAAPLPIIMDEVLVNFDAQRAERTARAFVDLSVGQDEAHQLFYFTCHPHIADMLRKAEPHAALFHVENGTIRPA